MQTNNKLREALETMSNLFERGVICTSYANSAEEIEQIEEFYRKAKAALAEPVKNCEVGTAEEQAKRLNEWCSGRHCINCQFRGGWPDECKLKWAQTPYKEGGAK